MTPHFVRPPHHELPAGTRHDGAGHDGMSLNRRPRKSTAPPGLFAPAPEVVVEKTVKAPKRRQKTTIASGRPSRAKGTKKVAECGTDSGFKKHWREGTERCQPCKDAHRDAARKYDALRRGRRVYVREHCGSAAGIAEHLRRRERRCDVCVAWQTSERKAS